MTRVPAVVGRGVGFIGFALNFLWILDSLCLILFSEAMGETWLYLMVGNCR